MLKIQQSVSFSKWGVYLVQNQFPLVYQLVFSFFLLVFQTSASESASTSASVSRKYFCSASQSMVASDNSELSTPTSETYGASETSEKADSVSKESQLS